MSGAEISTGRNATIAICLPIANSYHLGLIQAVRKALKSLASLLELENRSMHHGDERRATEVEVAVHALNRMLELGRPSYVRIA